VAVLRPKAVVMALSTTDRAALGLLFPLFLPAHSVLTHVFDRPSTGHTFGGSAPSRSFNDNAPTRSFGGSAPSPSFGSGNAPTRSFGGGSTTQGSHGVFGGRR